MPILDNVQTYTDGSTHFSNEWNPGWDEVRPVTETIFLRIGTGRRRKPVEPDMTPYEFHTLKCIAPVGHGRWTANSQFEDWKGFVPLFLSSNLQDGLQSPLDFDQNLVNLALVEALSSLNMRDFDLGTAWAERGKTASLVADLATKTVKTAAYARKGQGRRILDLWGLNHAGARGKGVVDAYLAYHYGVKPLLYDVAGAVQALTRTPAGDWRVSTKAKKGYKRQKTTQVALGSFYPYLNSSNLVQSCKVSISANQKPLTRKEDLAWSLGLDNPLATAWELTPFSFVADWVIPIGDYLSALNSLRYYDGWLVCTSSFRKEVCTFKGSSGVVAGFIDCSSSVSGGAYEKVDVSRGISTGPPMPGLPIKDPRSLDHMAKALALLASTLSGQRIPRMVRY
jgi:hypothetical protein